MNKMRNWEVIYEVAENPGDFFQSGDFNVKWFLKEERDLPPSFFREELIRFREMENPQKRGRDFDYFIGLLFQQLECVEIRVKDGGTTGEVDVHMTCIDAPDWLYRITGSHTLIENKWEKNPIQKGEVIQFYGKANAIQSCEIAYFVSMSGFSRGSGKKVGSLSLLRNYKNPGIIDFWSDDVEKMAEQGTPEPLLRERLRS